MSTNLKVASFDLDGTLLNGPFPKVLSDLGVALDAQMPGATHERDHARAEILRRHKALLVSDIMASYDWESIAASYIAERGYQQPFDLLERLDMYAASGATKLIHQQTRPLLSQLRDNGWQVVILTNGWRRYQLPVLRHCGLLDLIDRLICSDDAGEPKPGPRMFTEAGGDSAAVTHIGDRIDHDVVGGNRAGAQTILLRADVPFAGLALCKPDVAQEYVIKVAVEQGMSPDTDPAELLPTRFCRDLSEVVEVLTDQSESDRSVCSTTS